MGLTITASAIGNYGVNIDSSSYTSNDNPFTRKGYWGQCTWYCWGRANEHGISLWWGSDTYGNAKDWYDNASAYYRCDQTPSANSILVSPDGWTNDGTRVGHVMFVEKVENGYAYTTEANYWGNGASVISWNGQTGRYHEDVINLSNNCRSDGSSISITGYIHLKCANHTWDGGTITKEATCKKDGTKKYTCTVCGETKTEKIPKSDKYHKYKVVTTVKATMQADGKLGKECTICKKKAKSTIYHPKTIKLEKTVYTYNGKTHKPKVIIKDTKGNEIPSKYYTVSYKNNKNVGASTATVKFKTRYSGSKKLTFGVRPKGTSVSKLTARVKAFTVKWKKQATQTNGYQIQYSTSSKFTKKTTKTVTIKENKTTSKKITGLKANKKYYVRVRTYKNSYYSKWSKAVSVKVSAPSKKLKTKKKVLKFKKTYKDNRIETTFSYPKVSGSSTAAKKINKAFSSRISEWNDFNDELVHSNLYSKYGYELIHETKYTVTENTVKYISFLGAENTIYRVGPHLDDQYYSMTFNSKTGKKVTASSIMGISKAEVNKKARNAYINAFEKEYWDVDDSTLEKINKVDFNTTNFYLKNDRIYFYSDAGAPLMGGTTDRYIFVSFDY